MDAYYEVRDDYLYAKLTGMFTSSDARHFSFECVKKAHSHALNRILCDITLVAGYDDQVPTMTRFDLSKFIVKTLPRGFMLAVLETPRQCVGSRFDENVMVNRGASVKVTPNLPEALEWLDVTSGDKLS